MKFRKGDRVVVVKDNILPRSFANDTSMFVGETGILMTDYMESFRGYLVEFDNMTFDGGVPFDDNELALVSAEVE